MLKKYFRIDPNKNTKLTFYIKNILSLVIPDNYYRQKLSSKLGKWKEDEYIAYRVNYANKLSIPFTLSQNETTIAEFKATKAKKNSSYYFDLLRYLRYFTNTLKINYLFGDIIHIPDTPTIVKSRPIDGNNENSIMMKLDQIRHFIFVNDNLPYEAKKDLIVWRGKVHSHQPHRVEFLTRFYNHPKCNVGQTNTKGDLSVPWQKKKMSLKEQLEYKFILSIEGNDVASNLKWVMSSNSLAFMTKPKYETWFMEGTLIPNYHYVLLKDDYSDLEEKVDYYIHHVNEAKNIIKNANDYIAQFKNQDREDLISLLVLKKYFELSGQLVADNDDY